MFKHTSYQNRDPSFGFIWAHPVSTLMLEETGRLPQSSLGQSSRSCSTSLPEATAKGGYRGVQESRVQTHQIPARSDPIPAPTGDYQMLLDGK